MVRVCTMFEIDFDTTLIYGSTKKYKQITIIQSVGWMTEFRNSRDI